MIVLGISGVFVN